MPGISRQTAAHHDDHGPVLDIHEDIGDLSVNFLTFKVDIDGAPLLKGLPGDRCSCPHWGYVTKGKLTFRFGDREEVFEAGDAFYAPPGHIPVHTEPGSEYLQFSPADELRKTSEVIMGNMQAMQAG